ncbi:MAG: sigma factor-like helix-turn-helix DNA-binding protein [Nanoarchaeota archaeon]
MKKSTTPEFVLVPSGVFTDRTVSVLESMVRYLKEEKGFTYKEIALMLNRDQRTIWTVYSRARRKI